MCRAEVAEAAESALARLLADMLAVLCAEAGTDPALAWVGPVDFGGETG